MKNRLWITQVICIISILIMTANAGDLSKAIIYDVPEDRLEKHFGPIPPSTLTRQEKIDLATTRFDGDTLKLLVILVEWSDRQATYPKETFVDFFFAHGTYPAGSIYDYFDEVSYGQVTVEGDVYGWYDAGPYNPDFSYDDFENILWDLDTAIDFTQYDGNNDTIVDAIIFLRSGNGEEDTGDPNDIWSYALRYWPGYGEGPFDGNMMVSHWCTSPETMPLRDSANPHNFSGVDTLNGISVAAHEISHNLGLPDLYDYDSKLDTNTYTTPNDDNDHPFVDWCLMGYNGYGLMAIKKKIPPHLTGWCKVQMGWGNPIVLESFPYHDLVIYDVETHADSSLYIIPIDTAESEYFLLEYRNPHSSGKFDKLDSDFSVYLWPFLTFGNDSLDCGLQITHVHDSVDDGSSRMNNGTPDYPHYAVVVEDAGYNPSMDAWSNPEGFVTDSAQWWYPYETRKAAMFSNNVPGQSIFGPNTYPNSDGYNGPTNIYIRVDSIVNEKLYAYVGLVSDFICGDANGDEDVNIFDITYIISYLYKGGPPPDPMESADVNADGTVNIFDVTYLISYLYGGGPPPTCL